MAAHGQVLDRIDVQPAPAGEAEIIIRMMTTVQYLRHAPLGSGNALRIYFRVTGADAGQSARERENLRSPPSAIAPGFRLSYPENDDSLLVTFEAKTSYQVRQGRDNRSISVFVPALPGAGAAIPSRDPPPTSR